MEDKALFARLVSQAASAAESATLVRDGISLDDPDFVHDLRITTKRLRAFWILARPIAGPETAGYGVRRLRQAGRLLAAAREEFVVNRQLDRLVEAGGADSTAVRLVRADLFADEGEGSRTSVSDHWEEYRELLRQDAAAWRSLDQSVTQMTDMPFIRGGFQRTYRKARGFGRDALILRTPAGYHRWRRWVKYLFYQMEWFTPDGNKRFGPYTEAVRKLGSRLGRLHDIHVLQNMLADRSLLASSPKSFRTVVRMIGAEEKRLLKQIEKRSNKVFDRRSNDFGDALLKVVLVSDDGQTTVEPTEFVPLADHEGNGVKAAEESAESQSA